MDRSFAKLAAIPAAFVMGVLLAGCGTGAEPEPSSTPTLAATPSRTPTSTITPTPTDTLTPTRTPSPTPIPVKDRDLSAVILQPSEIPDYYNDVKSYSGPSCLESNYAEFPEIHENLVNGYDRFYLSLVDISFYDSSVYVYADEPSAQKAYRKIIREWTGNLIDVPSIGSESFGGVMFNLYYGLYLMDVVWRSDETVMELAQFAIRRPDDDEMVRLAREIQRRLDSPPATLEPTGQPVGGGSGQVAFITEGMIATIGADGGDWTCVTTRNPTSAAFSPDGKRFAFTSAKPCPAAGLCKDRSEIYLAKSDGSDPTLLASQWAHDPAWSPDGSRILYAVSKLVPYTTDTAETYLNVVATDGANPKELAELGSANFGWSPDGQTVAFTCKADKKTDICTVKTDGSGLVNLTQDKAADTFLQWSPDGKKILFASNREGSRVSLFVIDAGGGAPEALIDKGEKVSFGAWSPSGDRIAYVYNYHTDIFTIQPDGGGDTQLTDLTASDVCPVWSPDGKKIAFITQRNKSREVFSMNADGSDQKLMAAMGGYDDYCPVWVPG